MIYAYQVYELILDLARKDSRGRSLSPEEYNRLAKVVNQLVFEKYYKEFESTLDNSEVLSKFKVIGEAIAIGAGGIGSLPANYYHMVGMPYYYDSGGDKRFLDMVSSLEFAKREQDYLTKSTLTHPTYRLGIATATSSMTMYVTPTTGITTVYADYIRTPNTPILDYYVNDTTAVYTWMSAGALVTVPSGSTTMSGITGSFLNFPSTTVNWEFDDEDLPLIGNLFMQQMGITIPDETLYQGGTLNETRSDNL